MQNFSFIKSVVVRTPLCRVETDITLKKIEQLLENPQFKEALFIASPSFYEIIKKENRFSDKVITTLYKYFSRLSNRCTPFGLFATVGVLQLKSESDIQIKNTNLKKRVGYDRLFLGLLNEKINADHDIREHLKYYPNNSLYRILDKFRYVEYYYEKEKRYHRITEVEHNDYLAQILELSQDGRTIYDIVSQLVVNDISREEARTFIHSLVDAQFLISELDMTLTGKDYLQHLTQIFEQKRFDFSKGIAIKSLLLKLKKGLSELASKEITGIDQYQKLFKEIKKETDQEDLQLNRLFQVDTFREIESGSLSHEILRKIRPAITVLNKLKIHYKKPALENFKKQFLERYEHTLIPLCQVLDPDSGISYTKASGAKTPLLNNLELYGVRRAEKKINWDGKREFLLKKLVEAYRNGDSEIHLRDEELNVFDEDKKAYPDSFSIFFSVFSEKGNDKIMLKSVSGPSANNLIGRFGYLDERILAISEEICALENKINPNKILAEIIHLPEARTGNILYRKFQRNYEIPYLAKSSLNNEQQININDIYVAIKNDKVILYSKSLGKEIIPRLGNAHNYSYSALPIYEFLCDLQNQNNSSFLFDWGSLLSEFPFLPRVVYKDIVLSKRQWILSKDDIDSLLLSNIEVPKKVKEFANERHLPQVLVIAEGDNEVIINFQNDLSCKVFYDMVKRKNRVVLQEFLMENVTLTDGYANEFIAFAAKNTKNQNDNVNEKIFGNEREDFYFGSKWCYYKIYCGNSTAEEVLKKAVAPIINHLKDAEIIERWFFIRFIDKDGHHIRLRIKVWGEESLSALASTILEYLEYFTSSKVVWKVQTDTYVQESERYGSQVMEETEMAFQNDSDCALAFIELIEGDEGEKIRWLFSLLSIDYYLNDFGFSEKRKMDLMELAKNSFGDEFDKGRALNKKINLLYKEHEKGIQRIMEINSKSDEFYPLLKLVENRSKKNKEPLVKIREQLENNGEKTNLNQIFISHIHMVCNRLFLDKQRQHETVIYDLLYQFYRRSMFKKNRAGA